MQSALEKVFFIPNFFFQWDTVGDSVYGVHRQMKVGKTGENEKRQFSNRTGSSVV